jgi:hypothetical protein
MVQTDTEASIRKILDLNQLGLKGLVSSALAHDDRGWPSSRVRLVATAGDA